MRIPIVSLCILLLPVLVWAGTFKDNFDDGDLKGWFIDEEAETIEIINGEVVITDFDRDIVSQLWFNGKQEVTNFTVSFDGKVIRSFDSWPYMWLYFRVNELNDVEGCGAVVSLSPNPNVMWCHLI